MSAGNSSHIVMNAKNELHNRKFEHKQNQYFVYEEFRAQRLVCATSIKRCESQGAHGCYLSRNTHAYSLVERNTLAKVILNVGNWRIPGHLASRRPRLLQLVHLRRIVRDEPRFNETREPQMVQVEPRATRHGRRLNGLQQQLQRLHAAQNAVGAFVNVIKRPQLRIGQERGPDVFIRLRWVQRGHARSP